MHNIFELRQAEQKFYKLGKIYAKRWKTENWEIYVESQSSLADIKIWDILYLKEIRYKISDMGYKKLDQVHLACRTEKSVEKLLEKYVDK